MLHDSEEEKKEVNTTTKKPRRKSTLERLHLGFIARLIGRGYASEEEEKKERSGSDRSGSLEVKQQAHRVHE